jgi:hypothetical protein
LTAFAAILAQQGRHLFFTYHGPAEIVLGISMFDGVFRWYFNIARDPSRFPAGDDLGAVTEITYSPHQLRRSDMRSYLVDFRGKVS